MGVLFTISAILLISSIRAGFGDFIGFFAFITPSYQSLISISFI